MIQGYMHAFAWTKKLLILWTCYFGSRQTCAYIPVSYHNYIYTTHNAYMSAILYTYMLQCKYTKNVTNFCADVGMLQNCSLSHKLYLRN